MTDANTAMVERVAAALGTLRERVVFVGGCATGLMLTDPAAAEADFLEGRERSDGRSSSSRTSSRRGEGAPA